MKSPIKRFFDQSYLGREKQLSVQLQISPRYVYQTFLDSANNVFVGYQEFYLGEHDSWDAAYEDLELVLAKNISSEISAVAKERDLSSEMVIKAIRNSWVEIEDIDGNSLMARIMRPGETYVVPNMSGLTFNTGNAGALSISYGDMAIPSLGEEGETIKARPLNIEAFKDKKIINEKISAYVSASQGYSPPTTSNVVIPYTGEVNTGLNPETATQYEIGTKGNLLDRKLSYQLAFFRLNVQDKLTSRAVTDKSGSVLYTYTVNSGDQINDGVELSLSYTAIDNKKSVISTLRPFVTLTYSDFNYDDFKSDANNNEQTKDYSGNTVIGVPPLLFNVGLNVVSKYGFYFDGSFQYVDDMYITFDNNHEAPAYSLLNAKLGYQKTISKHWNIDLYAGGNNLTNSLYYNMVFINWERGAQPSIYSPGAFNPTFYGGAKLKYTF